MHPRPPDVKINLLSTDGDIVYGPIELIAYNYKREIYPCANVIVVVAAYGFEINSKYKL